jgi:hypothetical protein
MEKKKKKVEWEELRPQKDGTLRGRLKGKLRFEYVCIECKKGRGSADLKEGEGKKLRRWCVTCLNEMGKTKDDYCIVGSLCLNCDIQPRRYGQFNDEKEKIVLKWCKKCARKLYLKDGISLHIKCKECDVIFELSGKEEKDARRFRELCLKCEPKPKEAVPMEDDHVWKVAHGYPRYEISDRGEIRAIKTKKMMSPVVGTHGYFTVNLRRDEDKKKHHTEILHRLVCLTWHGLPEGNLKDWTVDHISCVKTDNSPSNLRWATRKQQLQYAHQNGLIGKPPTRAVEQFTVYTNKKLASFPSSKAAAKQLIKQKLTTGKKKSVANSIGQACNKQKLYLDFRWKYSEELKKKDKYDPVDPKNPIDEKWAKIPNFENYEISTHGRIKNSDNYFVQPFKSKRKSYYLMVSLRGKDKKHFKFIHRLLAQAHIENPNKFQTVNHKDGNIHNNIKSNLEWCPESPQDGHMSNAARTQGIALVKKDKQGNVLKRYKTMTQACEEEKCYDTSLRRGLKKGKFRGEIWEYDAVQNNNAFENSRKRKLERAQQSENEPQTKKAKVGS